MARSLLLFMALLLLLLLKRLEDFMALLRGGDEARGAKGGFGVVALADVVAVEGMVVREEGMRSDLESMAALLALLLLSLSRVLLLVTFVASVRSLLSASIPPPCECKLRVLLGAAAAFKEEAGAPQLPLPLVPVLLVFFLLRSLQLVLLVMVALRSPALAAAPEVLLLAVAVAAEAEASLLLRLKPNTILTENN